MIFLGGAVCATLVLVAPSGSPERVVAALLLVFVLPGLALSRLVPVGRTGAGGTALLALSLSVVAVILVSAGLYAVGARLDLTSWALSLAAVTVLAELAALFAGTGDVVRMPPRVPVPATLAVAGLCAAALLTGAGIVTATSVQRRERSDRFTQLWAMRANGGNAAVTIGVANHEGMVKHYRVAVLGDGRTLWQRAVSLGAGQVWTTAVSRPPSVGDLRVNLTAAGSPHLRRWVALHYGVASGVNLRLVGCSPVRVRIAGMNSARPLPYVLTAQTGRGPATTASFTAGRGVRTESVPLRLATGRILRLRLLSGSGSRALVAQRAQTCGP
jgi:hypothetical protein